MNRLFAAFAAVIALLLGFSLVASPANADTPVPNFYKTSGWWNTANPDRAASYDDLTVLYGSSDKWIYPDFPIACNANPGDGNHYRTLWIYPNDVPLHYSAAFTRKVLAGASSVIEASAQEVLGGSSGFTLKQSHSPRWQTTAPDASGACYPTVETVAVPRSVLDIGKGAGYWLPYKTGQLDDWLEANGYLSDKDEKIVALLQEWGQPDGHAGITTSSSDPTPGRTNFNNDGGDAIYVDMHEYDWSAGRVHEWADGAHNLAHEMTHNLGANVTGHPNTVDSGHAPDCGDVLCERLEITSSTNPTPTGYYAATGCGLSPGYTLTDLKTSKFYNRLDCNNDDYWNRNTASWVFQRWNTYYNSFLWANSNFEQ